MTRLAFVVAAAMVLAGCSSQAPGAPSDDAPASAFPDVPEGSTRFLLIGDQGLGNDAQYAVAEAMYNVCVQRGCQFVVTAGDNIYGSGPNPARGVYDVQFDEKFELPYEAFDIPFYLTLGNHDNGNGAGSNPAIGDIEVAYTYRTDRMSDKWNMPQRYYTFTHGDVQIFALDSGPEQVSQATLWLGQGMGPEMEEWYRQEMASSTAKWKLGVAHHPYISNGAHGDAGAYDNTRGKGLSYKMMLDEIMCGATDVFLAGHDHDLQWLEPTATCDTEFIISGAASGSRSQGVAPHNPARFEQYETLGFVWIDITGDTFTGVFYDFEGNTLFEHSFTK